ncbi:MAG: hypothetical protein KJ023_00155 [Burkholderiaceae bacterium]|nr:hypothetical protein [Burkholderiaceae bacterium]
MQLARGADGQWTGKYVRDAVGNPLRSVCHSFVGCNGAQPGQIVFLSDCTHALAGQVRELAPFPSRADP